MTALYLDRFGLHEDPFAITPDPRFFFAGQGRGALLQGLAHALLELEGIVTVTGEVGTGKTLLCRMLLDALPADIDAIYLAHPTYDRHEILDALAVDLGLLPQGNATGHHRIRALQEALIERHGLGRRVVLIVDEAHVMAPESLEEIRLLSNIETRRHKLLHILLVGQPELDTLLARRDLRQLRDRIVQHFRLAPLPGAAIRDYLECRLRAAGLRGDFPLSAVAVRCLGLASGGRVRRLNILADKALLSAFAQERTRAGAGDVHRALVDLRFAPRPGGMAAAAGLILAACALLAGLQVLAAGGNPVRAVPTLAMPSTAPGVAAAPATTRPAPGAAAIHRNGTTNTP